MCLGIPGVSGAEAKKFRATKNQRNMFFILKCRYYVFIAFHNSRGGVKVFSNLPWTRA